MTTQFVIPSDNILSDLTFYLDMEFKVQEITSSELGRRRCFISDGHTILCLEEWEEHICPAPYLEVRVLSEDTFSKLNSSLRSNLNAKKDLKHRDYMPYYSAYQHRNMGFELINIMKLDSLEANDSPAIKKDELIKYARYTSEY